MTTIKGSSGMPATGGAGRLWIASATFRGPWAALCFRLEPAQQTARAPPETQCMQALAGTTNSTVHCMGPGQRVMMATTEELTIRWPALPHPV